MGNLKDEFLAGNAAYAPEYRAAGLTPAPVKHAAILTCMDARILPSRCLGIREGDAHIIRNAGGRASDDAIRSLIVSYKMLGTREFHIIHHTDCGMNMIDDETITDLLASSLEPATNGPDGWSDPGGEGGSFAGHYIKWLTFKDQRAAIIEDVRHIREHPLIPSRIPIFGYIFDAESGQLHEVEEATRIGAAS